MLFVIQSFDFDTSSFQTYIHDMAVSFPLNMIFKSYIIYAIGLIQCISILMTSRLKIMFSNKNMRKSQREILWGGGNKKFF